MATLAPTSNGSPARRLTILVVDDNADMRFYVKGCLRRLHPRPERVVEAADAAEALRMIRAAPVHLVISDVAMPGMDGYALCRALKGDPATRAVPVLLISGAVEAPPAGTGADAFLAKPFNTARLRAEVERLLDRLP